MNRPDRYLEGIARIRKLGIRVWGSFIFGFDNDNLDTFRMTRELIEKSGMEFAQFSLMTPLPGTALYRQFEEEARIFHKNWKLFDLGAVVFRHPTFSARRLHWEKNHAYRRFYSIPSMIRRLGFPKTRSDLITWTCNLAVRGVLQHKWGNKFRSWKDPDPGFTPRQCTWSPKHPIKIEESERLVKLARGPGASG